MASETAGTGTPLAPASRRAAQVFLRGVGCNWLVCLAVWMTLAARTVSGKILAMATSCWYLFLRDRPEDVPAEPEPAERARPAGRRGRPAQDQR